MKGTFRKANNCQELSSVQELSDMLCNLQIVLFDSVALFYLVLANKEHFHSLARIQENLNVKALGIQDCFFHVPNLQERRQEKERQNSAFLKAGANGTISTIEAQPKLVQEALKIIVPRNKGTLAIGGYTANIMADYFGSWYTNCSKGIPLATMMANSYYAHHLRDIALGDTPKIPEISELYQ